MSMVRYLTEEEALKVLCPNSRTAQNPHGYGAVVKELRSSWPMEEVIAPYRCHAASCMFWRRQLEIEALGQTEQVGKRGFCALYGVESPKAP